MLRREGVTNNSIVLNRQIAIFAMDTLARISFNYDAKTREDEGKQREEEEEKMV